jgi:hypothetical protein
VRSTGTILSFLRSRGLAQSCYKESPETWPADTVTDEQFLSSRDQVQSRPSLDRLAHENEARGDLSPTSDNLGEPKSNDIGEAGAWSDEEFEEDIEADMVNEDWPVSLDCPVHRLPWQMHHQSIALFAELSCFLTGNTELCGYEGDIRDELARLFLWGESFGEGRLDNILEDSTELRLAILELCTTISEMLIKGGFRES